MVENNIIKSLKYYIGINGLRAISIFLVLVFQSNILSFGRYHFPVYFLYERDLTQLNLDLNPYIVFIVEVLITILISILSWNFMEKWFISKKTALANYDTNI